MSFLSTRGTKCHSCRAFRRHVLRVVPAGPKTPSINTARHWFPSTRNAGTARLEAYSKTRTTSLCMKLFNTIPRRGAISQIFFPFIPSFNWSMQKEQYPSNSTKKRYAFTTRHQAIWRLCGDLDAIALARWRTAY